MRRITPRSGTVLTCSLLAGLALAWAATDRAHAQPAAKPAKVGQSTSAGKVQLILTRTTSALYLAAPAMVKVNGQDVASLGRGESSTLTIAPGRTVVSVSTWSYPGSWTINLDAKAGQTYAIEISRGASFVPSFLLGPLGGVVDAAANPNAGAFQMHLMTPR